MEKPWKKTWKNHGTQWKSRVFIKWIGLWRFLSVSYKLDLLKNRQEHHKQPKHWF